MMPSQFRGDPGWSPTQRLMYGILTDAVRVIEHGKARKRSVVVETAVWFMADDPDDEWPFTFLNICAELKRDPARVRAVVMAAAERNKQNPTSRKSIMPHRLNGSRTQVKLKRVG